MILFSEKSLVSKKKLVDKAITQLKKDNYVLDGYLTPPKGTLDIKLEKNKKINF